MPTFHCLGKEKNKVNSALQLKHISKNTHSLSLSTSLFRSLSISNSYSIACNIMCSACMNVATRKSQKPPPSHLQIPHLSDLLSLSGRHAGSFLTLILLFPSTSITSYNRSWIPIIHIPSFSVFPFTFPFPFFPLSNSFLCFYLYNVFWLPFSTSNFHDSSHKHDSRFWILIC